MHGRHSGGRWQLADPLGASAGTGRGGWRSGRRRGRPISSGGIARSGPETLDPGRERGLERWIAGFRARALAQGIRADVFERAFRGRALRPRR